jgi:hypothetical protein
MAHHPSFPSFLMWSSILITAAATFGSPANWTAIPAASSSLGETFSQSLSKNENGGRDGGHFVGVTLAAFGLSRHRQERDCRDYDWTVGHRDGTTDRKFLSFMRSYPNLIPPLRRASHWNCPRAGIRSIRYDLRALFRSRHSNRWKTHLGELREALCRRGRRRL